MVWTPEPTYEKPDISVRATTLYYQIVAPLMLPFIEGRLLNLLRCREGKCFFQRNREHPPIGGEFDALVKFQPVGRGDHCLRQGADGRVPWLGEPRRPGRDARSVGH
ncbi:hypothetical protein [Sphingomonas sp.]|uniref:hypothetical protein n=1 Tax=Sphingomonas sp. TaxID=28214 RepID=UPI00183410AE|nr:hypothetical protein [Sphingomonas sp.]MBA3511221.1 hypothetical protein [Sphingomonas sp.]